MSKQATISTHNGSTVAVDHNLRDPAITAHEPHIDPNGPHEVWAHEDLRDFYERTFGQAQQDYDAKQGSRDERKIGDYLDKLTRDAAAAEVENEQIRQRNKRHKAAGEKMERLVVAKKPVYEMICGVYGQDGLQIDKDVQREILRLYVLGDGTDAHPSWQQRNPGLQVTGIYYHGDEPDAGDHVHLDYVPVAKCPRGMAVQNSLERALNSQGMKSGKVKVDGQEVFKTAQMQFEAAENAYLQTICEEYGFEIIHPQRGKKSAHKSTAELKRETALAEREKEMAAREKAVADREAAADIRDAALDGREAALKVREREVEDEAVSVHQDAEAAKIDRLQAEEDRKKAGEQLAGVDREIQLKRMEVMRLNSRIQHSQDRYALLQSGRDAVTFAQDLVQFAQSKTNSKTGASLYDDFLAARKKTGRSTPRDVGKLADMVQKADAAMSDDFPT